MVPVQSTAGDLPTKNVTVTHSRDFCASPHVGHERRSRPVFNYRITDSGSLDLYFLKVENGKVELNRLKLDLLKFPCFSLHFPELMLK